MYVKPPGIQYDHRLKMYVGRYYTSTRSTVAGDSPGVAYFSLGPPVQSSDECKPSRLPPRYGGGDREGLDYESYEVKKDEKG